MKKCSKSHHHALAELNITPLLDLAFVLLVIFIITTTPAVNDIAVELPKAEKKPKNPKPRVHYVTVQSNGEIILDKDKKPLEPEELRERIVALRAESLQEDPTAEISVIIRGSAKVKYQTIVDVMDMLQQSNVLKVDLATETIESKANKG
jgi:biopolymer transport protein ExbD